MNNRISLKCDITGKYKFECRINIILKSSKGEKVVGLYMKLIEACPRHNVILYKDEECTFRYGQFNYARCLVDMVDDSTRFHVHEGNGNTGLLFEALSLCDAAKWIRAFQRRTQCPYSPFARVLEREHCVTTKKIDSHRHLTMIEIPY